MVGIRDVVEGPIDDEGGGDTKGDGAKTKLIKGSTKSILLLLRATSCY